MIQRVQEIQFGNGELMTYRTRQWSPRDVSPYGRRAACMPSEGSPSVLCEWSAVGMNLCPHVPSYSFMPVQPGQVFNILCEILTSDIPLIYHLEQTRQMRQAQARESEGSDQYIYTRTYVHVRLHTPVFSKIGRPRTAVTLHLLR